MPEYLILKLEGDSPCDAKITAHIVGEGEPAGLIKQGFDGDGRYAIVNWDERVEGDLALGPAEVSGVEDKAAREVVAEAAIPEVG